MAIQTKEELLVLVEGMDLELATKEEIRNKVTGAETVDEELTAWIKEKIQEEIDGIFAEAGVTIDENDPEYRAQFDTMMTEIDNAEKDFQKDMEGIAQEMTELETQTAKQLDEADADAVAASIKDM